MATGDGCEHNFTYLLKMHGDASFTGRVLQLPAVIAAGKSREEVREEIENATLDYLHAFETEHKAALDNRLEPKLVTPQNGVVLETIKYNVRC